MKEIIINLINWFFDSHQVNLTGWQMLLWIAGYPLVFMSLLAVIIGYLVNSFAPFWR